MITELLSTVALFLHSFGLAGAAPDRIALSQYRLTFSEDFNTLDVTAHGPSRWTAHTWWNGDFGDAAFTDPGLYSPFSISNGVLTIRAAKALDGSGWQSGLLSSIDPKGHGFAQRYGYFEMRAKLPPGSGVWPAFWLVAVGSRRNFVEIDAMEYYGRRPDRFSSSLHVWRDDLGGGDATNFSAFTHVPAGSLSSGFHLYGVEVNHRAIGFYLDRRLVSIMPTPAAHNRPLGVLVNLGLGGGWPIDATPNPSRMLVDYVRVYALPPGR